MHDAGAMRAIERLADLRRNLEGSSKRDRTAMEPLCQRLAIEVSITR